MKKIFPWLAGPVLLLGGVVLVLTLGERDRAEAEVAVMRQKTVALEQSRTVALKERDALRDESRQMRRQLEETRKRLEPAGASNALAKDSAAGSASAPASGSAAAKEKPMKAMADMMKSPAMRELAKQQHLALMEGVYARLYERFQLDDVEKANFKQLLADRTVAEMDLNLKMMDDSLTAPQRQALKKEAEELKKRSLEKLKTFLNNSDDYRVFEAWEETKEERMALSISGQAFGSEPLTSQQEQQLVDTMHQIAKQSEPKVKVEPENVSLADMRKELVTFDSDALRLQQQAAAFLTPGQIEALKTMQQQWRAIQEMGIKMAESMK